jgi:hypothetical protein
MKKAVAEAVKTAKASGTAPSHWGSSPNAVKKFIQVIVKKIADVNAIRQ